MKSRTFCAGSVPLGSANVVVTQLHPPICSFYGNSDNISDTQAITHVITISTGELCWHYTPAKVGRTRGESQGTYITYASA